MKIEDLNIIGNKFAYDGCHKIYIIEDDSDIETLKEYGWNVDTDIHDIKELKEVYNKSCGLRFISNVKLTKQYVKQFSVEKLK